MSIRGRIRDDGEFLRERVFFLIISIFILFTLSLPMDFTSGSGRTNLEGNAAYIEVVRDGRDEGVYVLPLLYKGFIESDILRGAKGLWKAPPPSGSKIVIKSGYAYNIPMDGRRSILFGMPIDVNTADVESLEALPGIGESIALRVVEKRNEIGYFNGIDDLKKVKGIGDGKIRSIKGFIRFGKQEQRLR